jgi:hypothetical protein
MMFWDNQAAVAAAGLDGSPMDEGEESADSLMSYLEDKIPCEGEYQVPNEYLDGYHAYVRNIRG